MKYNAQRQQKVPADHGRHRVVIGVVVEATVAANSYCGMKRTKLAKNSRPQLESETTQSSPVELTAQSFHGLHGHALGEARSRRRRS